MMGSPIPHEGQLPVVPCSPPGQPQSAGCKDKQQRHGQRCSSIEEAQQCVTGACSCAGLQVTHTATCAHSFRPANPTCACYLGAWHRTLQESHPRAACSHTLAASHVTRSSSPAPATWVLGTEHCRSATRVLQPVMLEKTSWCTRSSCMGARALHSAGQRSRWVLSRATTACTPRARLHPRCLATGCLRAPMRQGDEYVVPEAQQRH